jgi:DNA-binding transcriptional ArsR family regulator
MTARDTARARARLPHAAPLFAALGDATRLRFVARLCESGPQSTARLRASAAVSRQAATKHLEALEQAGVVHSRRDGRERIWALRGRRLAEARGYLDEIAAQWDDAIGRLRAFVETDEP